MLQIDRQVDAIAEVVTLCMVGELGDQDLRDLIEIIGKDAELQARYALLIDLSQAKGQGVTPGGVRELVKLSAIVSVVPRLAVVVPSSLGFGMARMYHLMREEGRNEMQIFRDLEKAHRWAANASE